MSSFGEASGGQRVGRVAALVALEAWLGLTGLVVFILTVMGFGSCSTDACSNRGSLAVGLVLVVHVGALGLVAWLALRRTTGGRRTLALVLVAVVAPVLSLGGAFLLAQGTA